MNIPSCGSGIANWRDRDAYPQSYADISEWNWRWEFLRRNPEYQRVWHQGIDVRNAEGVFRIAEPGDSEICQKVFRVRLLTNPWGSQPISSLTQSHDLSGAITINPPDVHGGSGSHLVLASFYLDRPLNPQITEVSYILKKNQLARNQELIKFHRTTAVWPRHLRVIDAKDQGATLAEIADQFVEDGSVDEATLYKRTGNVKTEKSRHKAIVSQWHSQAREVMDKAILWL